jgi:probable AcnD-accessory protein PrpF
MSDQIRIPATYMRGGTSKGVFFRLDDLPEVAQTPGTARDNLLLRVIGSPDPYGKHTDGMGGATSSTSKTVILSKSTQENHDVDYLFGQVAIDRLVDAERVPRDGICEVRIWQANIGKTIIAHVPMTAGEVQETGDFELDGVTFPAAEVRIEFLDPADAGGAMFPTGALVDTLQLPQDLIATGQLQATLINAGIPTIFLNADELGYSGCELQEVINGDPQALNRFEQIRAHGALRMGLIDDLEEAAERQHTPKIAFVAPPADYIASSGKPIAAADIDLNVRAVSMGKLHHAMMGTAAVAIATAAAIPGTLVNQAAGGGERNAVRFGHPSGTLKVGARAALQDGEWVVEKVAMSRSARVLMDGQVRIPGDVLEN